MKKIFYTVCLAALAGFSWGQVTNGLVSKYSFNGGNANDDVGGYHGTVAGATLEADRFGNPNMAYRFDETANIDCGSGANIEALTTAYSISAWFNKTSSNSGYQLIVAKWTNTALSEHFWLGTSNDQLVWATAGQGNQGTAVPGTFSMGDWHHVVMTWESTGQHKFYLDNVLVEDTTLAPHTVAVTAPVNMRIGAEGASYRNFGGLIDDVRIYNRVINAAEVDSLFNDANPAATAIGQGNQAISLVKAFPNPAKDLVNFTARGNVTLTNVAGQTVLTAPHTDQITISALPAGMYILQMHNEKGIILHRSKLIKE